MLPGGQNGRTSRSRHRLAIYDSGATRAGFPYSILNNSNQPVEIVPPQIQITGRKATKKKTKEGKGIISDQLEIREFRLSTTRLEPGERADGVVVFDRPNFKESTEKLFLQIAQADQVDRPILIHLPFTPPISGNGKEQRELPVMMSVNDNNGNGSAGSPSQVAEHDERVASLEAPITQSASPTAVENQRRGLQR